MLSRQDNNGHSNWGSILQWGEWKPGLINNCTMYLHFFTLAEIVLTDNNTVDRGYINGTKINDVNTIKFRKVQRLPDSE